MKVLVSLAFASVATLAACGSGAIERAQVQVVPPDDPQLSRIAEAVNAALTARPPSGQASVPRGVRLLTVDRRRDGAIGLSFNESLLLDTTPETLEDALDQILTAAAAAAGRPESDTRFEVLVDGVTVDSYRLRSAGPGSSWPGLAARTRHSPAEG